MLRTVEGVFRDGAVEQRELPDNAPDGTPVFVTFLLSSTIDLAAYGIGPAAAAELRVRPAAFAGEWDSPEMAIYDDYDVAWAALQARRQGA